MGGEKIKYFSYGGIAVFVLAIIYFVVSVYTTMVNGETRSQYEFSSFVQQSGVQSLSSLQSDSDTESYFKNIEIAVDNNSYVLAATMNISDQAVFAYPLSSNVIQVSATQQPILLAASPMLKTYSMSLPSQNGQQIILNAVTYILRPQDIYNSARVSFLIILAYTLFLIVVIVYDLLSKGSAKAVINEEPIEFTSNVNPAPENVKNDEESETISVVFRENESAWDEFFSEDNENQNEMQNQEDSINEDLIDNGEEETKTYIDSFVDEYIDDEQEDILPESNADSINDTGLACEEEKIEDSTVPEVNDPMGLFSDITGVGWESYMETRLDSELIRAASSEQDLALLFIQLQGIEKNISAKKKIATLLLEYFKFRDFVFEYKEDGFSGILLDVNLDQTMVLSEQLYQQLESILLSEGIFAKIGIGISTRSLRILPGSRIITEAEQAVARALEEDGLPIVAFRVSPEKYRQFVSNTTT